MSVKGNAESYVELRGSLSNPDLIIGKSAYEIAVSLGFKGTEKEWLASLKGDKYVLTEEDKNEIAQIFAGELEEVNENIENALDAIIEIQNSLIGGEN